MEERLWNYIDGLASLEDRATLEALLATDNSIRDLYTQLLAVHAALDQTELEAPSLRFTKNVMDAIAHQAIAPATPSYINKYVIRAFAALLLVPIVGILVYLLVHEKGGTQSSNFHLPVVGIDTAALAEKGKIFSGAFISVFMFVAVVSGLILLDMFVLRKKGNRPEKTTAPSA